MKNHILCFHEKEYEMSAIRTKPPLGNHYHDERFLTINETALKLNK